MPTLTYIPIATATVSGSSTNAVTFNSISSAYTDLVVVVGGKASTSDGLLLRFNGDSAGNYARTYGYGTGAGHGQGRQTANTEVNATITTTNGQTVYHINNYQSTSMYKTVLLRNDYIDNATVFSVSTWKNTATITSIVVSLSTYNFAAGTTVTLYGIV